MRSLTILVTCVLLLAFSACGGNPFAPEKHTPEGGVDLPPAPDATSPAQAMDNLARAMRDRDKDLYETLLDQDFWFTKTAASATWYWSMASKRSSRSWAAAATTHYRASSISYL